MAGNTQFAMSSGGIVHVINKASKNIDAAKQYLEFRLKPENAKAFYAARQDLGANLARMYRARPPWPTKRSWKNSGGR